jgi:hypothetical protein
LNPKFDADRELALEHQIINAAKEMREGYLERLHYPYDWSASHLVTCRLRAKELLEIEFTVLSYLR